MRDLHLLVLDSHLPRSPFLSALPTLVWNREKARAKVSRLVKNLKERGVVDIEPISGRENKVILKIKGVEVSQAPEKEQGQKTGGQGD